MACTESKIFSLVSWGNEALHDHNMCVNAYLLLLLLPRSFLIQLPMSTRSDERPNKLHENQWLHRGTRGSLKSREGMASCVRVLETGPAKK